MEDTGYHDLRFIESGGGIVKTYDVKTNTLSRSI